MTMPIVVDTGDATLNGDLTVPSDALGVVVFAHGSGSSRLSPRNQSVARELQDHQLATLLFDLLRTDEERADVSGRYRFDLELLTPRLIGAIEQLRAVPETSGLRVGVFGASTGAAVALLAAARRPDLITAVVSRGGRPDLAGHELSSVRAPTQLIVGERDEKVLELNRQAAEELNADHEVRVIDGATHLFEEEGALEQVSELAGQWFATHLAGPGE